MIKKTTGYKAVCDVCGGPLLLGDVFKSKDQCMLALYAGNYIRPALGGAHVCSNACYDKLSKEIEAKLKAYNDENN